MTAIAVMRGRDVVALTDSPAEEVLARYAPPWEVYAVRLSPASAETVRALIATGRGDRAAAWLRMMAVSMEALR